MRRGARQHFKEHAQLSFAATLKGKEKVDPGHPLYRVCKEWHTRRTLPMAAIRPSKLAAPQHAAAGGGAYAPLEAAELLLRALQAEEQGLATLGLEVPKEGDPLAAALEAAFCSSTDTDTSSAWNEQRKLLLGRLLRELLYPHLARELKEVLRREAQQVLIAECAKRLRTMAVDAAPVRVKDDLVKPEHEVGRGKKKKSKEQRAVEDAWRPSALVPNQTTADGEPVARKEGAEWYPRPARVVGLCVNVEDKEAELAAIDEAGELVDTFKCRWLMTNIRARRDGGGASALDIERKLGELERLALFMQESRP